jgi:hypothetical protein
MADWFSPKRYGMGSGLPIAWQGWVLTIGFIVLLLSASLLIPYSLVLYFSVVLLLTGLFLLIAAKTTPGGWRWRWGDKD